MGLITHVFFSSYINTLKNIYGPKDQEIQIYNTLQTTQGCCETIRVASSYTNSISMQSQRYKMGVYKTIGKMNGNLVYEQQVNRNYAFAWKDKQGLIQW